MRIHSILAAVAAASMASAPVIAAPTKAAPAANTEIAPQSETVDGEQIRGGFLLPLAIIIAIILGVILLTHNGDEEPISS